MIASWGASDDWSRAERSTDRHPDRRADIPAEKWAELAARHAPRRAQHVGRDSYQSVAGRLAALEVAHTDLATRHAALVAVYDRLLADNAALADERDAWRLKAAEQENDLDRLRARLADIAAGHLSWFVGGMATPPLLVIVLYALGRL